MQGNLAAYMEEKARNACLKSIQETIDWLYGEGETSTSEIYLAKTSVLMQFVSKAKDRQNYSDELQERLKAVDEWSKTC